MRVLNFCRINIRTSAIYSSKISLEIRIVTLFPFPKERILSASPPNRMADMNFEIAKSMGGRFIPNDIWTGITGSGIIIADLTNANPNVSYEIGLADVLGREVILICQGDKVPFDFLGQRLIVYQDSIAGTLKLREELIDRLNRYKNRIQ